MEQGQEYDQAPGGNDPREWAVDRGNGSIVPPEWVAKRLATRSLADQAWFNAHPTETRRIRPAEWWEFYPVRIPPGSGVMVRGEAGVPFPTAKHLVLPSQIAEIAADGEIVAVWPMRGDPAWDAVMDEYEKGASA